MLSVQPGFANAVFDSQIAFRSVLTALSEPGRPVSLDIDVPAFGIAPAAVAVMLALVDIDTPVWFDPSLDDLRAYLRFHTGALSTDRCGDAAFALVADIAMLPPVSSFCQGTAISPETSATLIVGVADLTSGIAASLSGPGLASHVTLAPAGFDPGRWEELSANHARFPGGVDVVLCCGAEIVGLPRSTRITPAPTITTATPGLAAMTSEGTR